ncbi:hypothetical protein ABZ912_29980 [Nonomuraea angiospora]|uniref:hypothetical protein n=1 Tax=Nonomuraea angiospora TaxID=46172 RepID=UPI0033DC20AD
MTATAASGVTTSVVLVWVVVAALVTTMAITLTRAVVAYRRAYRDGQEHAQWAATVMEEAALHAAGIE